MLVLSRKVNENIVIDGRIVVKVVRTEGNFVKLGIEAPPDVPVHRQEIYDEIQRSNQAALIAINRPQQQSSQVSIYQIYNTVERLRKGSNQIYMVWVPAEGDFDLVKKVNTAAWWAIK